MTTLRTALALTAATCAAGIAAAPAGAWSVAYTNGEPVDRITFTAALGEVNAPSLTRFDPVTMRLTDPSGVPSTAAPCSANADAKLVQCPAADVVHLKLGDKGDVVLLGDGVAGDPPVLDLSGETGNDTLSNQKLGGTLDGGAGTDILRPGRGADVVRGGSGLDAIDYSERTIPVRINFFAGDAPEQGEQGEGDRLPGNDVEVAFGGKAGDVLIGNGRDEQFIPGPGKDTVDARQGDDVADLRDGEQDTIACGLGTDTVYADQTDVVAADCENVSRKATSPSGLSVSGGSGGSGNGDTGGGTEPAPPTADDLPGGTPDPEDGSAPGVGGTGDGSVTPVVEDPAVAGDATRPVVTLAHLTRRTIRRGGTVTARSAAARSTSLRFAVSESAALAVTVQRVAPGRRSGGRCVRATRALRARGAKRCTRAVAVTTLRRGRVDGTTSVRLTARIGRARLAAGRHRLTLVATDVAGNRSAPVRLALHVAR